MGNQYIQLVDPNLEEDANKEIYQILTNTMTIEIGDFGYYFHIISKQVSLQIREQLKKRALLLILIQLQIIIQQSGYLHCKLIQQNSVIYMLVFQVIKYHKRVNHNKFISKHHLFQYQNFISNLWLNIKELLLLNIHHVSDIRCQICNPNLLYYGKKSWSDVLSLNESFEGIINTTLAESNTNINYYFYLNNYLTTQNIDVIAKKYQFINKLGDDKTIIVDYIIFIISFNFLNIKLFNFLIVSIFNILLRKLLILLPIQNYHINFVLLLLLIILKVVILLHKTKLLLQLI